MNFKQLIITILASLLLGLALYIAIAYQLLDEPPPVESQSDSSRPQSLVESVTITRESNPTPGVEAPGADDSEPGLISDGRKLVEIFGRVQDRDGRPLEGVLIAEERYFYQARSDAGGNYKILLDLPRFRYPALHFLRSGYDAKLVKLGKKELDQTPVYLLDVTLEDALDSVTLQGWVGNDIGLGLEGARVQLTASYARNKDSFYLTRFTDGLGNFEFEGVRSGETYKLSVDLTPEYPYYEDSDFVVTQSPAPVNILLQSLQFVDIDGMILNRESTPVTDYELYIENLSTGIHKRKIVSDSSGFFRLDNFPLGEIRLSTRGPEFNKIAGMTLRQNNYQNLVLTVDRGSRYLSGWVSDENGVAVPRAMVTLDRKFKLGEIEYTSYRSQATGEEGSFSFSGLGSGEYHVTVYAWGYQNQDLIQSFDTQSTDLRIVLKPDD